MSSEMLEKIDAGVAKMVGKQEDFAERLKSLEGQGSEVAQRLKAYDERLDSQDEWLRKVEATAEKARFPVGDGEADTLRNMLPEDLRRWVPRVKALNAGPALGIAPVMPTRSQFLSQLAAKDPVKYVAVGGWFQANIKAALATKEGRPKKAQEWNERADKLGEALGGFDVTARAALQEDTAAEGGNLIPTVTEAVIGWLMKEYAVVRRAGATVLQMTTKTHQLPKLDNDFTVAYIAEEGTISDSAPATPFSQGTLTAKKQAGLVTVSIELIQDNIVNLMDFVVAQLVQAMGRSEDTEALEGDGTNFTGLFSASGTNSVAGGSDALSFAELVSLIYGGEHQATVDDGVIFCHPFIVRDAIQLVTGSAGSVWLPFAMQNQGMPTNLLGVPTYKTSVIDRTRGVGTDETTAYHGNPAYIVIGDRTGATFDVNPWSETEFKQGQILLRLIRRHAVLIWVPGYFTKLTAVTV